MLTRRTMMGTILAAPAILAGRPLSAAPVAPEQAAAAGLTQLAFSDDFDSLATIDLTGNAMPHREYKWFNAGSYAGPRTAYSVHNSILTIALPAGGPPAELWTCNNRFQGLSFQYFYAECRFAFEPQDNNWPCFWGICVEHFDGSGDNGDGMELDVVEMGGRDFLGGSRKGPGLLCTLHRTGPHAPIVNRDNFTVPMKLDPARFNTYGALWVPGRVTWYVNDRPVSSYAYREAYWDGPRNHLEIGFGSNGAWEHSAPPPWSMQVDWVRIWTGAMSSIRRS